MQKMDLQPAVSHSKYDKIKSVKKQCLSIFLTKTRMRAESLVAEDVLVADNQLYWTQCGLEDLEDR